MRPLPLSRQLPALLLLSSTLAAVLAIWLGNWFDGWLAALLAIGLTATLGIALLRWRLRPANALLRALAGTVASYRDGDFSFGIRWDGGGELGELAEAHNQLGTVLREQRQALVQRELLLDTMVQNTPVAMLLLDPGQRVTLGNLAARKMLGDGSRLEGRHLDSLLPTWPAALRDALLGEGDGLFLIGEGEEEEICHLARRRFRLNGRRHELILLRRMTTELRRQEVQTWKKVIRVISHELNNSLAPIASLAHSGLELLRRGQHERLPAALATIEERARHLEGFIRDYARFAKLPAPRPQRLQWAGFLQRLGSQFAFAIDGELPVDTACFDVAQMEQALLNLLKNAHESGSAAEAVRLAVRRAADGWRIDVLDRGGGMNETVMAQALLPFYSTKRSGTGLGLALAREIAEAHGGRIALSNRDGGGLCVSLFLPAEPG
ncbi:MAG: ATP-binding protein [Lysobacteraceae bacterium]